ncbi:hypothetical protein HETIRDRAFT_308654 [Heterobasidion irregulare TC 32-1]|uniref:Uncharacterized protein n=1 Tax=Heterobasidion irregulare (strain TC 32-1) TaxID=747525 RepID=W4KJ79_HETIT|nr:uncharacterized protein HETIRDRAFT_308654 [Heterobasidion irregulare TC 32-1]ETW85902.1 hypothetical protein HETIRDRAFT_308654 [Heterobasidion irregulare TC 32-1]
MRPSSLAGPLAQSVERCTYEVNLLACKCPEFDSRKVHFLFLTIASSCSTAIVTQTFCLQLFGTQDFKKGRWHLLQSQ